MHNETTYTTEEIANMLKISKLTVYDLIKKGELPAYRVGKQMRVEAVDLEQFKQRSKGGQRATLSPESATSKERMPEPLAVAGAQPIVIAGQDAGLDVLAKFLKLQMPAVRPLRAYVGSMEGLVSLYRGESDLVSIHLLDGDTGEYNLSYVRKLFVGSSYMVINLLSRWAGFYVPQGNPLQFQAWRDLGKQGITIVNREQGSGARVLLDEQLKLHGIKPEQLHGYEMIETNHMGVAGKVANGEADVGIGSENASLLVGLISFIPLIQERLDIVLLKKPNNLAWIAEVCRILQSAAFQQELRAIHGYDLSQTGQVLFET